MPTISHKGRNMPESPIRKLAPFADLAKQKGHKVYHLNIGQPDIKTPEVAIEAVKNIDLTIIEYSPSAGYESYRKKLAKFYQRQNVNVNSEDIIVTTGGSEALLFALATITDPGDEIIIPEPFYANYHAFASSTSATVVPVISTIESGFALPSIETVEKLITPKTKAILICNPGNPTGYLYTEAEIKQLATLIKKHDLYLIADEVYREFLYDGDDVHYSVMNLEDVQQNVIMVDSVSKRYSMCGARIGCLVTKNKDVLATVMKFAQARLSPPTIEQIACEAAIDTPQSYFDEVISEYKSRRDTLITELNKIDGVIVTKPKGAFYCIAQLPIENADDFAQWLLESYDLNGETVMVAPAAGFYSTPGMGLNQVRIAYVLNKKDLITAVNILKEALLVYNKK
ncbi:MULTISPECIES: pyridoxal phosphate-dependent aminotransferase [unclassified Flavobacterium]|jgi:aspartate aminotransferase|uniref:pyridoxal phosphate-dependent aminotransferase n=1 Tax=unclassified Flavobacterium TaxID=196869 RepID=UPI00057ECB85|nr:MULTISPECIES: pyridoxal phosphate-dependent aminotransferase [unclassified Flavobacterium]KIC00142.1 aspartate aminotransferase [Flavobacterium sp. KMS]KIC02768.1 aspartate aminotransferase [Flavobacterium sp. JRM]MEA9411877.1 pyridoxal phosphate-dependent aminotransferase [Flavobacterium sp. PL02]